mgnify:CR=1 FL=1
MSCTVSPLIGSFAPTFTFEVLSLIFVPFGPNFYSVSRLKVVFPLAFISSTILVLVDPIAIAFTLEPLSLVVISIRVNKFTMTLRKTEVPLPIIFSLLVSVIPDHNTVAFSESTTHLSLIYRTSFVGISYLFERQRRIEYSFLLHDCLIILLLLKIYAVHLVSIIPLLVVASSLEETSDQRLKFYKLTNYLRTQFYKIWLPIQIFCLILATFDDYQIASWLLSLISFFIDVRSLLIYAQHRVSKLVVPLTLLISTWTTFFTAISHLRRFLFNSI